LIAELCQKAAALLGHLGGERWIRLPSDHLAQLSAVTLVSASRAAPVALAAPLMLDEIGGLASGEKKEDLPEVAAIFQPGEAALLGGAAETVEGAEGHVLLVGGPAGKVAETSPRQRDHRPVVALPQPLDHVPVARSQASNPARDVSQRWHEELQTTA